MRNKDNNSDKRNNPNRDRDLKKGSSKRDSAAPSRNNRGAAGPRSASGPRKLRGFDESAGTRGDDKASGDRRPARESREPRESNFSPSARAPKEANSFKERGTKKDSARAGQGDNTRQDRTSKSKPAGGAPAAHSGSKSPQGIKSPFGYRPKAKSRILKPQKPKKEENPGIRLNKYIANAGICSRREADELIKAGVVEINGTVVTEMGVKVQPGDEVKFEGQRLKTERNVYVLLNKPKDYITTLKDPQDRRTVMALVKNAAKERIYPVGRLDRNTTGVLLFTNDGEMSTKLTHPRHGFKKIYHVHLDSNVKKEHMTAMLEGIELEDGFAKADAVEYVADAQDKSQVGIEIHIGRNRIVRRMFEHFGYKIKKLDRVYFAGLTKKDLPRGKWRPLTEQEVNMLKMLR